MFVHGETVVVRRAARTVDRYGNETPDWSAATHTAVDGVAVAPLRAASGHTGGGWELGDGGRQGVIVGYTLLMPAGADVTAHDRVVVRGRVCEVVGEPGLWRSPFSGWEPGVEVAVRTVEG